jgi:hypothetical protein
MLQYGSTGADVRELQSMLNGQPPSLLDPLAVDGIFGPLTRGRVVEYQRCNGLDPDGIVGPLTFGVLKSKVLLVPASPLLCGRIAAAGPARRRAAFTSPRMAPMASFLIPVPPGSSTTQDLGDLPIDAAAVMPPLPPLEVQIVGIVPDPTPNTSFDWVVNITFDESSCALGKQGVTPFSDGLLFPNLVGGSLTFAWPWIRGGNLEIAARATVNGKMVEAIFTATITGTDPAIADIRAEIGDDTLRRIANVESGFHQFEKDSKSGKIVPKFNFGNDAQGNKVRGDGGAGICQITVPPPTAEQIWNWKANVKRGKEILAASRGAARTYLDKHRVNGKLPNRLGLPDSEVILREAIQGYKGGRFWQWNDGTSQWEDQPPNAYVHNVLTHSP